jgi:proton-translocating NADH-quinone oxidoreductase chain M
MIINFLIKNYFSINNLSKTTFSSILFTFLILVYTDNLYKKNNLKVTWLKIQYTKLIRVLNTNKIFFINFFTLLFLSIFFLNNSLIDHFLTNPLFMIIGINIITIIFVLLTPIEFKIFIRSISFFTMSLNYFISLILWFCFDRNTSKFQFFLNLGKFYFLNTDMLFGIDGISLFFVLLTTIISPILILISWYINNNVKILLLSILLSILFTILTFSALDLFLFFIVFECLLIPLFISILYWGSGERKIKASIMLFLYTILSSFVFMISIFTIYLEVGSTNFFAIISYSIEGFSIEKQKFLWRLLFIAFAIKVPLYPLHTWLPEAHVEAPTFGSVILASLLLKTGGYGLFRYVIPIFPEANIYYTPLVYCLALIGVIYAALSALRQLDIKRIVAYLSISHMNFCVLGQFSENLEGILGSLLLMIAHGIIAAGFFISIGVLYKRYHTRLIMYFGGLARIMPVFSLFLFILTLGNMNMPGTSNFVGELLILIGIGHKSLLVTLFAAIGSAIGALCTIWLWSKIMFGELKLNYFIKFSDLSRKEFYALLPLILINFIIGLFTNEFIDTMYCSAYFLHSFLLV